MARWTEEMLDALADRMSQASETQARSEERFAKSEERFVIAQEYLARSEERLASSEERLAATNDAFAETRESLEVTRKIVESNEANSNAIALARVETEELKKTLSQFIGIVGEFVRATNSRLGILEDRQ